LNSHTRHPKVIVMSMKTSNEMSFLFGFGMALGLIITGALLYDLSGDSTTPKPEPIMPQLIPTRSETLLV